MHLPPYLALREYGWQPVIASLYHAAQSFFVIVNDGIGASQQSWLLATANIALTLILVFLCGPALRRGTSELPAVVDVEQTAAPQPEAWRNPSSAICRRV